jgi:hypothetical protein
MTENKTRPTALDPEAVIKAIGDDRRRADIEALDAMMRRVSGAEPVMWGPAMFGYGAYHYRYASGRSGDFFRCGFANQTREIVVYVMSGFSGLGVELSRLGPHKTGKSCLYVKRLDDIGMDVLEHLVVHSIAIMAERYPERDS